MERFSAAAVRLLSGRDGQGVGEVIQTVATDANAKYSQVSAKAVGIQVALMSIIGAVTVLWFNFLLPNNKVVYAPKYKYAEVGKAPPRIGHSLFSWIPPLVHTREAQLLPMVGLDAVVFLRFTRMMRNLFTLLAILMGAVLIPVDLAYNLNNQNNSGRQWLSMITISQVKGSYLWGHVVMSYAGTAVSLALILFNYRTVVRLRWDWFRSEEYQKSHHSRTLMITHVDRRLQSDSGLGTVFSELQVPYPTTEVHIGRKVGVLPELIEKHSNLVRNLEQVLTTYLKDPNKIPSKRPMISLGSKFGFGGDKVDAIDYYTAQINRMEAEVERARERIADKQPESYGFASFAAVPYAHQVAKRLVHKRPKGTRIELAPPPKGIIWQNLNMSDGERMRSKIIGGLLLAAVCFVNTVPLLIISVLSNLAAVSQFVPFLDGWSNSSQWSFSAASGVLPPTVSALFGYFLPVIMRRIAKFSGELTRTGLDRKVVAQYFFFLVFSQFLIFSFIGVGLSSYQFIKKLVDSNTSAIDILSTYASWLPGQIKTAYVQQSNYWLTWYPLRGYLAVFDLAQIIKLFYTWFRTIMFGRTPRDIREFTKPPDFEYAVYYSILLFMAAVGFIYACLAPLILTFAAVAFCVSAIVYKYQLMFVFTTKVESGGRLWPMVVNRLLVCIVFMQIVLVLAICLDQTWFDALVAIPPVLGVIVFKIYLHKTYSDRFLWYIPDAQEIAQSHVHVNDARNNRLQKRFGHPALHQALFTPMVHAKVRHLLPRVYRGRLENASSEDINGRKVATDQVMGGLKIAAIEEGDLEYDPRTDSDARSLASSAFTDFDLAGRSPLPGSASIGGYFSKTAYEHYLANGPGAVPIGKEEEFEMSRFDGGQLSTVNLLDNSQPVGVAGGVTPPMPYPVPRSVDDYQTSAQQYAAAARNSSGEMTGVGGGYAAERPQARRQDSYVTNYSSPYTASPPVVQTPLRTPTPDTTTTLSQAHGGGGAYPPNAYPPPSYSTPPQRPGMGARQPSAGSVGSYSRAGSVSTDHSFQSAMQQPPPPPPGLPGRQYSNGPPSSYSGYHRVRTGSQSTGGSVPLQGGGGEYHGSRGGSVDSQVALGGYLPNRALPPRQPPPPPPPQQQQQQQQQQQAYPGQQGGFGYAYGQGGQPPYNGAGGAGAYGGGYGAGGYRR